MGKGLLLSPSPFVCCLPSERLSVRSVTFPAAAGRSLLKFTPWVLWVLAGGAVLVQLFVAPPLITPCVNMCLAPGGGCAALHRLLLPSDL